MIALGGIPRGGHTGLGCSSVLLSYPLERLCELQLSQAGNKFPYTFANSDYNFFKHLCPDRLKTRSYVLISIPLITSIR